MKQGKRAMAEKDVDTDIAKAVLIAATLSDLTCRLYLRLHF